MVALKRECCSFSVYYEMVKGCVECLIELFVHLCEAQLVAKGKDKEIVGNLQKPDNRTFQ